MQTSGFICIWTFLSSSNIEFCWGWSSARYVVDFIPICLQGSSALSADGGRRHGAHVESDVRFFGQVSLNRIPFFFLFFLSFAQHPKHAECKVFFHDPPIIPRHLSQPLLLGFWYSAGSLSFSFMTLFDTLNCVSSTARSLRWTTPPGWTISSACSSSSSSSLGGWGMVPRQRRPTFQGAFSWTDSRRSDGSLCPLKLRFVSSTSDPVLLLILCSSGAPLCWICKSNLKSNENQDETAVLCCKLIYFWCVFSSDGGRYSSLRFWVLWLWRNGEKSLIILFLLLSVNYSILIILLYLLRKREWMGHIIGTGAEWTIAC